MRSRAQNSISSAPIAAGTLMVMKQPVPVPPMTPGATILDRTERSFGEAGGLRIGSTVTRTFLHGQLVFDEGAVLGAPTGRSLRRPTVRG